MKKLFVIAGLAALVFTTDKTAIAKEKGSVDNCVSAAKVEFVAKNIPKHFKKTSTDTYLIDNVPQSKNGYNLGGRLSVYIPENSHLSVFDRTDANPSNWYNISNWDSAQAGNKGCVDFSIHLTGQPGRYLPKEEAQSKFNAFVNKVYDVIKTK